MTAMRYSRTVRLVFSFCVVPSVCGNVSAEAEGGSRHAQADGRETHYVNNVTGSDANDGRSPTAAFATIAKAISASNTSGRIALANTGRPYREAMVFKNLGGTPARPFIVEGNGAVLNGHRRVDIKEWRHVKDDLYFLPIRIAGGDPYLTDRLRRLPQNRSVESLRPGQFYWQTRLKNKEEGIFFKCDTGKTIDSYDWGVTERASGFMIGSSSHITCRNLVCEYFANDGFNGHGDCRGLCFENVVARYNGDDGMSIHAFGEWDVRGAHLHHNGTGVSDIDGTRTTYKNVLVEHNRIGVQWWGQFHSLVDCVVRDNQVQMSVHDRLNACLRERVPVSGPCKPIAHTRGYVCDVIFSGASTERFAAVHVADNGFLIMRNCVINGAVIGLRVDTGGGCHVTTSIFSNCGTALQLDSDRVFTGTNLYTPSTVVWQGTTYSGDEWEQFRVASGLEKNSRMEPLTLKLLADGRIQVIQAGSPAKAKYAPLQVGDHEVGPSEPLVLPEAWVGK